MIKGNKVSNRYSVLINNCRVIAVLDWLIRLKDFLASNYEPDQTVIKQNDSLSHKESVKLSTSRQPQQPVEIKLNLTNTDLVLVEKTNDNNSQAVILRLTAFIEYNQRKLNRPFESCLQSVELFSCQMNSIQETALSIIDPVTFNIYLSAKNNLNKDENELATPQNRHGTDFILDISTELIKLRFSYLDFKLFLRLVESIKKQFQGSKSTNLENKINNIDKEKSEENVSTPKACFAQSLKITMTNFCICIIDDCKDVDIPLVDIQFNRIKLVHYLSNETEGSIGLFEQGSAEFGLNIDYYNRLLSGWEPLVEPWLARLNWRFKPNTNSFTLTSMDVLNINVTNPFIDLITGVLANWKAEYENELTNFGHITKRHKIFQPYKIINLTGEQVEYCTFKDTNSSSIDFRIIETSKKVKPELDLISSEWTTIEDKSERQFNFYYDHPK